MTGAQAWVVLRRDFPKKIRESLLRGILAASPAAFEAVSPFERETGEWLQPYHRHALLRDTLAAMERRFKGVKVAVINTDPPTTNYVTLSSGQSILTAASVQSPGEMARWAKHRESLAGGINYDLFDKTIHAKKLYAILYCGPEVAYGAMQPVPAFAGIGIPDSDYGHYIWNHPLFDEFPGVVHEATGAQPKELRQALLLLRRRAVKGDAG